MKIAFADLFDRLGTPALRFSSRAAELSGREVSLEGYVTVPHAGAGSVLLVDSPGACPDCSPAPVAAVCLPGFDPGPLDGSVPVTIAGRLEYGFAVDAGGNASFLRITGCRMAASEAVRP